MSSLAKNFEDYSSYHQTPGNKITHMVGIPIIVVTLLGLFSRIGPMTLNWGTLAVAPDGGLAIWFFAMIWYFWADWKLALPFSCVTLGGYFLGRTLPNEVLGLGFVFGWVLQFIGHYRFEKKSPAFYKNAEHLLVGPFWVFAHWIGYRPSRAT